VHGGGSFSKSKRFDMKVPLLANSGVERSDSHPVTTLAPQVAIPNQVKVAVAAALLILGVSESVWTAAQLILKSQNCAVDNGIAFFSSVPFLLVPVFAAVADSLRGSVVKRQPMFTAGVIIAFLSVGLLGISARQCAFVTAMSVISYLGVSISAALALGILLDRLHRCELSFAVHALVFFVVVPLFVGKLISHIFIYFNLCTRTFLIGFSLVLLLVMFITLLVPDVVVLSKANLALEQTFTQYIGLFNLNYAKILIFLLVWKLIPTQDATLESLFAYNNLSSFDLSKLKFIYYVSRLLGAVKLWWLLKTNLFKGYFKASVYRALVFILTAQVVFIFVSVLVTAHPPANMIYAAAVLYLTAGIKEGFSFACVLVLGSRMHSEALNSFACTLVLSVFTVSSVGGAAVASSLDSSFSVSSGQGWIAVFISAVLHFVPIIVIRYTMKSDEHVKPIVKGVSALEISFEEVMLFII
jgi:hypothetical protein